MMGRRNYVNFRHHHGIATRRSKDVPLRCLGNVPLRRCWVFHLRRTYEVAGTYREKSLQRRHNVLLPGEEVPLINCEIKTWSSTCVITNSTGKGAFATADKKFYVPVVALSAQDNTKLLEQLKSGFKRKINWNKYRSKNQ